MGTRTCTIGTLQIWRCSSSSVSPQAFCILYCRLAARVSFLFRLGEEISSLFPTDQCFQAMKQIAEFIEFEKAYKMVSIEELQP